ncbi:MAG: hypothetical protein M1598_08465 [Actinobacteria bacterium]|nr:hypothetical protein [Actinomycetota bacterium]
MDGNIITVTRTVPSRELLSAGQAGDLLNYLRQHVRDLYQSNPGLAGCHLYDVGFVPKEDKVELRFYFRS